MIQHSGVGIIGTDGRGEHEILRRAPYSADFDWPLISPHGRLLLFELTNSPAGHPGNGHAVFVAHSDGSGIHRVTPWRLNAGDGSDWDPSGTRIPSAPTSRTAGSRSTTRCALTAAGSGS
jgi:hypothetical protein